MKVRDLSISKRYRDTVKRWGEPNIARKRVIIAPLMSDVKKEKDVDLQPAPSQNDRDDDSQRVSQYADEIDRLFKQVKIEGTNYLIVA